ncbi:MAG: hypothetical protein GY696_31885 [Gammaproteobacteria bacterium]|nr:hypothetical protein [Gammaproteobacteria bacterium]
MDFPGDSCSILASMAAMRAGGGAQLQAGAQWPGDQHGGEQGAGVLEIGVQTTEATRSLCRVRRVECPSQPNKYP